MNSYEFRVIFFRGDVRIANFYYAHQSGFDYAMSRLNDDMLSLGADNVSIRIYKEDDV